MNSDKRIFITGDVHQMDIGGNDQKELINKGMTEVDCALKYARLALKYDMKVTLFLSALVVKNESEKVKELCTFKNVEIGGHTYNSLQPHLKHLFFEKVCGSYYGSEKYQYNDIYFTIKAIKKYIGLDIQSWRTHAYRSDLTTFQILEKLGLKYLSDEVLSNSEIKKNGNLISIPINTPPDHEHLIHGESDNSVNFCYEQEIRKKPISFFSIPNKNKYAYRFLIEIFKKILNIKTPILPFGNFKLKSDKWQEWVLDTTLDQLNRHGFATLLLHPSCMEVLDGMLTFEEILNSLSSMNTMKFSDLNNVF